jgi:hypothetical protein
VLGIIFSFTLGRLLQWKADSETVNLAIIPLIIILINIMNFSILNIAYGYYILTAAGLAIFVLITVAINIIKPSQANK